MLGPGAAPAFSAGAAFWGLWLGALFSTCGCGGGLGAGAGASSGCCI